MDRLNDEQRTIAEALLQAARKGNYEGENCFWVEGPTGSGKTFLLTTIYHILTSERIEVKCTSFTCTRSTLLPKASTFCSIYTGIKYCDEDSTYWKNFENVRVIICDDASMIPRYQFECINEKLRELMDQRDIPFGGKIMILGGDFRQIVPVMNDYNSFAKFQNNSIKYSPLWSHFSLYILNTNVRVLPEETEFAQFLINVGNGNNRLKDNCYINLPERINIISENEDISQHVFGDLIEQRKFNEMSQRAILAPTNDVVDRINLDVRNLLKDFFEDLPCSIEGPNRSKLKNEIDGINSEDYPTDTFFFGKHCIVMLNTRLTNRYFTLRKGTRLQIEDYIRVPVNINNKSSEYLHLKCRVLAGDFEGENVTLEPSRIDWSKEKIRILFPVTLAFALTIHKSQGLTFEKIAIHLQQDVFCHGQLYTAFSRVKSWDSLKIYLGDNIYPLSNRCVRNIVMNEILENN